jgi:asparagine synthase (glutamine-hydrolysing)
MCGFVGYADLGGERPAERRVLERMTDTVAHRGPDSAGFYVDGPVGLGFRRLSIIDLAGGDQPIQSEDGQVVLICNGEIYNHHELRDELRARGHVFRTRSDVEVILHLYEERGAGLLERIHGQFSFVVYDRRRRSLLLARDHVGITPLYYGSFGGQFVFGSEIKGMLQHPAVPRTVDLTGLDQVLSFPGMVSPRTMFAGIQSLPPGHCLSVRDGRVELREYWDLEYPLEGEADYGRPESYYIDTLSDLFEQAVRRRLQAEVPVGFYLSGGLDSSMIGAMIHRLSPGVERHSFSITFPDRQMSEQRYQRMMAEHVGSVHHEIEFDWTHISERMAAMVRHCECPVKETYNTCSMALSQAARAAGVPVILTGEGADELFAGYVGYRFDAAGSRREASDELEALLEEEMRARLWGDPGLFYESDYHAQREVNQALLSPGAAEGYAGIDCTAHGLVRHDRLAGRHPIHQRSYLDFKLRLADHLLSDHGDRMALAHSIEARFPFLDLDLIEFARTIPPHLKLNGFTEKYALKQVARGLVPDAVLDREKFGFHAPGSPYLLRQDLEWVNDLLSPERIRRQGYFNPTVVEHLRSQYTREGFRLNLPFETDLLTVVLTFGILLDEFCLPAFN